MKNKKLDLPKPSSRYILLLKQETEKARKATANKYFKFGSEDGVKRFDKRNYLLDLPDSKIRAIAKECQIKRYTKLNTWTLVSEILKHPNINDILYKLLENDRHYQIDEEDLEAIKVGRA